MPLNCPVCSIDRSLKIVLAMALPPDNRSDDIILQVVRCSQCGFRGLAVYQESRRGALDSESWEHIAYQVPTSDVKAISSVIRSCPAPKDQRCQCAAHLKLGQRDAGGRWCGLQELSLKDSYPIR
jgi:hypothetical protein